MSVKSAKTVEFESSIHPRTSQFIKELLQLSPTLLKAQIA
jgi:hypothetical protein